MDSDYQVKPFALKELLPTEGDEAASLYQWAQTQKYKGKRLSDLLIMVPNGAVLAGDARQRAMSMNRMKAQGFKKGCADYFLCVPIAPFAGLWIELKRSRLGVVSVEQQDFINLMLGAGFQAVVSRGWEEARDAINTYLGTSCG